jgi:hypothetical protein
MQNSLYGTSSLYIPGISISPFITQERISKKYLEALITLNIKKEASHEISEAV